jgi:hypothetical protein
MVLRKTLLSCAALGVLTGASLMQAHAQSQLNFTGGAFNFSGSTFSASTTVAFNYAIVGGTTFTNTPPVTAYLTLTGTAGTATATPFGSQTVITDTLTNVSESINLGSPTGTQLVGYTGQSLSLLGAGHTLDLNFSSPNSVFTSGVFSLYGPETESLALTTNGTVGASGGALTGFSSATGTSNTFNAASVPEASTMIGLGGLVLGGGFLGLRRRKA